MEVAGIVQVLLDELVSLAVSIHAPREEINQLKKMEKMLSVIRIVLADAEDMQITKDLNDVVHDLDEIATEILRSKLIMAESQPSNSSKVRKLIHTCCTCFTPPPSAVNLDHNLMSMLEENTSRFKDIETQKNRLDLKESVGGTISYNFVADAVIREFRFAAFGFMLSVEDLYKSRMSYQNEPIAFIGPFRSKVSDLKAMEVQKLQFHHCMLGRISHQNETILHNSLGDAMIIKSRKWCWAEEFEDMTSDGCFTMELLGRPSARRSYKKMKGLLTSEYNPNIHYLVYMNGMKSGGFTTPDSQHVVANDGDIDPEIGKMLGEAGALKARDLANDNDNDNDVVYDSRGGGWHKPSHNAINAIIKPKRECLYGVLLLMASLVAKITYQAAFSLLGGTLKERYAYNYAANGTLQVKRLDSIVSRSFILFNSTGFVASVAVIIFLLHEFPLKPWPQITVSTLFGSYMCLIMATSPREALALLFLASPFLLLAAAGKLHGLARKRSY